jgi:hypothetical protein
MAQKQDATETGGETEVRDAAQAEEAVQTPPVRWNDDKMTTTFANVVNVQSTREQVDLFFGTNQTWNISDERSVTVDLSKRIILTPHAAKRMWLVLGGVMREYEARYGTLEVGR